MDNYNNPGHSHAAQNTYTGLRRPSNMTNTVTRTPQRRRPNTAYEDHDSGQQQHTVDAHYHSYAAFSMDNNPSHSSLVCGTGMETQFLNLTYAQDCDSTPGLLANEAQYYTQMNDVPAQTIIYDPSGQVFGQSLSHPPQMVLLPGLRPSQAYNLDQRAVPVYHQPSEGSDINEANDASGASLHAVGATAVRAALPEQQPRRQGRVKPSRPTASHDVADSNTAVDCNNGKASECDKNTEYSPTDSDSDKDSNDEPDIRKQKRREKYEKEERETAAKTAKFCKISNLRKNKAKKMPCTMPPCVYENFEKFRLSKGIILDFSYHCEDRGQIDIKYNDNGQIINKSFSNEDIRRIVEHRIDESKKSKVPPKGSQEPPKKDFTMWIQSNPCQANNRLNKEFDTRCRRRDCPVPKKTIRPGEFRVAFDELPYFTENGPIDPLRPALVLHLWCFEKVFSREETKKYLADGFLKGDTRELAREDRSLVTLEKDSKRNSRNIIEEWREASEVDQEASVQKMIDLRRQADAENDNSDNIGSEFYQERTYSRGHLASLTCALSTWHADMNTKYNTMGGNGTRPKLRKDRNEKRPKGIRNTMDYGLGDVESFEAIRQKQQEYKNKAAPKQHATAKQEDMEHRDSFDDPETKLLQAQNGFKTAQKKFKAVTKQLEETEKELEEAKKKVVDAQRNYDEAKDKREAEKHVEPEGHVPKKKATKKKGKRNGPAAQTAAEEASESLETAKGDCRRAPKERRSAKDTDEVEKFQSSVQQSAKSHVTARTNDLGERRGDEPSKENSGPSYINADSYSHSPWQCSMGANRDSEGEFSFPGTARQADINTNWPLDLTGNTAGEGELADIKTNLLDLTSPSMVLGGEHTLLSQGPMDTTTSNGALMPFTPMLTAWELQSRVLEEAPDSDEDRPLRVKQEPSQQRSLQGLPDYNSGEGDPRTMSSRAAAPRKRGQQQISDYNDAEEPTSTKRARIAAPQQVSNAAAACHTPSYGPNRPARNKRRADGHSADSFHKRMCQ